MQMRLECPIIFSFSAKSSLLCLLMINPVSVITVAPRMNSEIEGSLHLILVLEGEEEWGGGTGAPCHPVGRLQPASPPSHQVKVWRLSAETWDGERGEGHVIPTAKVWWACVVGNRRNMVAGPTWINDVHWKGHEPRHSHYRKANKSPYQRRRWLITLMYVCVRVRVHTSVTNKKPSLCVDELKWGPVVWLPEP